MISHLEKHQTVHETGDGSVCLYLHPPLPDGAGNTSLPTLTVSFPEDHHFNLDVMLEIPGDPFKISRAGA